MEIIIAIVNVVLALAAGFIWGRLWEMNYGVYRNAFQKQVEMTERVMSEWKKTIEFLEEIRDRLNSQPKT